LPSWLGQLLNPRQSSLERWCIIIIIMKDFKCEKCEKTYGHKRSLAQHVMIIHEKLKPFKCEKCEKTFGHKGILNQHVMSVHKKLKPFKCEKCDKKFSLKSSLTKHDNTVHKKLKLFKCDSCKMTLVVVLIQMKLVSVAIVESKAMIFVYAGNSMAIVLDARSLVT
jgi:uncharacterized Zn-finger protein